MTDAPENNINISLAIFLPPLFLALPFYNTKALSFFIFFGTLFLYAIGALTFHYYANKRGITKASSYLGAGALAAFAISFLSSFLHITKFFDIFFGLLLPLLPVCMLHSFVFWSFAVNQNPIYKMIAAALYSGFVFLFGELVLGAMED